MKLQSRIEIKPCGCVGLIFGRDVLGLVSQLNDQGMSVEAIHVEVEHHMSSVGFQIPGLYLQIPEQRGEWG